MTENFEIRRTPEELQRLLAVVIYERDAYEELLKNPEKLAQSGWISQEADFCYKTRIGAIETLRFILGLPEALYLEEMLEEGHERFDRSYREAVARTQQKKEK